MILLREIVNKLNDLSLKDKILHLNILIPRMDVNDSMIYLSSIEFLRGVLIGLKLSVKARQLESFDKESDSIDLTIKNLVNLYEEYIVNHKNESN